MKTGWHVERHVLERYANDRVDGATAASVEAHIVSCADCRSTLASFVDEQRLANVWAEIRDAADRPETLLERVLARLGVPTHVARLIAATPALRRSWLLANIVGVVFAIVVARSGPTPQPHVFLVIAPLIPLAGVASAFGPRVDPSYELAVATPMRGVRLLLLRAGAVLVTTMTMVGVAALWLPVGGFSAVAWLLPALAVTLSALALSTWIDPMWASVGVGVAWIVTTTLNAVLRVDAPMLDRIVAFRVAGQIALGCIAAVAAAVIAARAGRFDVGGQV